MIERLEKTEQRYQEIEQQMATPEVASDLKRLQTLGRERAAIENAVARYREYKAIARQMEEMKKEFNPETRVRETRELLKVKNTVEFRPLKRFDLDKIPGYTAAMEVLILGIITE